MGLDFLKPLFVRYRAEQAKPLAARERAIELVRKGVKDGSLNEADQQSLYNAMRESGTPAEHLEAAAACIEEFIKLEEWAAGLEKRRARARDANEAIAEFAKERARTLDRLNAEDEHLSREALTASQELQASTDAAKAIRAMQKERPEIVGAAERAPAALLLADIADRYTVDEFPTSVSLARLTTRWNEKLWPFQQETFPDGFDNATGQAELQRLLAAHKVAMKAAEDQDRAVAASGLKVFRLDPSRPANYNIDPADYDFRPAPLQSAAEFAKLFAVITSRAREEAEYRRRAKARQAINAEHNELVQASSL